MPKDTDTENKEKRASIIEEARKLYSQEVIQRWRQRKHMGEMENFQGNAKVTGPCGDTVEVFLNIFEDQVMFASFETDGCITTIASSSMACELAMGKHVKDAYKITQEDILKALGGLPEESSHCALLASNTMKQAIKNYLESKHEESWKKPYQNK